MSLDIIHPRGGRHDPEAGFIEPWADRKARRAAGGAQKQAAPADTLTAHGRERALRAKMRREAERERARQSAAAIEQARRDEAVKIAAVLREASVKPSRTTEILREVAAKHGVTVEQIKGPVRLAPLVLARQEAMWRLRQDLGLSLPQIGQRIGGRDHTTALHGIRKHAARLDAAERRAIVAAAAVRNGVSLAWVPGVDRRA